jgi:hypothetical protein
VHKCAAVVTGLISKCAPKDINSLQTMHVWEHYHFYSCQDSHPKPAALNPGVCPETDHFLENLTTYYKIFIFKFFCQPAALACPHMTKIKDCASCFVSDGQFYPQDGFFIPQKICS